MGWKKIYIEGYFSWLTCGQTVSLSLVSLSLKCLKSHEAHASPNVHATCGTFIDRETSKRVKKESFMMAIPSCDDCRFPKRSPSRILWRFFSKSSGSTFPLGDACRFLVDFAAVTTNKSTRWSIVLLYGPCTMVETEGIGRLHIWASGPVALTQEAGGYPLPWSNTATASEKLADHLHMMDVPSPCLSTNILHSNQPIRSVGVLTRLCPWPTHVKIG